MNIISELWVLELVLVSNFSLNWQFWFFGPNFPQNRYFWSKQKTEPDHWILHVQISLGTKFQPKLTILIFWTRFAQKGYSDKKKKSEDHHWILQTQISIGTKLQLKLAILIYLTKFARKVISCQKQKKGKITIEFCIIESVYLPNFSLDYQFRSFGPNLPKKSISSWK